MIPLAVKRKLGLLLAGLYLAARICGVSPLVSSESAHVAISVAVCCEDGSGSGPHKHGHHAGDGDDVAHHHLLQDLTGTVAWLPASNDIPVVHIAITLAAPRPFTEADAPRLERPPKSHLSI
jgi:hypothetical protein